jgi:replicative DNA helicase
LPKSPELPKVPKLKSKNQCVGRNSLWLHGHEINPRDIFRLGVTPFGRAARAQDDRRPPGKTDFDRVTAVSESLCELAKATQVPVVALSQLRRAERRDFTAEPSLEDLRQSGQIEQDAHAVFLLHRPRGVQPGGTHGGEAKSYFTGEDKIIIAKQRSGPAGTYVKVRFDGPRGRWEAR